MEGSRYYTQLLWGTRLRVIAYKLCNEAPPLQKIILGELFM